MTDRATAAEDQFFRDEEAERRSLDALDQVQHGLAAARAADARAQTVQLRRCPQCRIALERVTLRGVEIDRCALCKGIWLDDGELELLSRPRVGFVARVLAPLRRMADKSDFG